MLSAALCLFLSIGAKAQQNCMSPNISMSCQNLVHLSVGTACTETITPEKILAGAYTCYNTFEVEILNSTLGNTVGAAQIGQTLNVKVKHSISGNSCWGKVKIEDKLAPVLTCPTNATISCATAMNISLYETIVCDNIANNGIKDTCFSVFGLPNVAENCTGYTLSYSDVVSDKDCAVAGVSAIVVRTWKAKDAYGNTSTCATTFTLARENINWVNFPPNVTIECSSNYNKDAKGNPHPSASGAPTMNNVSAFPNSPGYCELSTSYIDTKTVTCGTTYKIVRKWTAIDWCTSQVLQQTQVIKVGDSTPPVIKKGANPLLISTDVDVCMRKVYVPVKQQVTDNCGTKMSFYYTVYEANGLWAVAKGDTLRKLQIGTYLLETKVTDECGNFVKDSVTLIVKDEIPPSAVCDLNTKVSVNEEGFATVNASTFDDGSTDNCGVDTARFEVKRMGASDSDFAKNIKFSCFDDKLQVVLRVWDYNNLSNTCMINVDVDDKMMPIIFAENTTLNCTHEPDIKLWLDSHKPALKNFADLPSPSNPGYFDNCAATLSIKKEENLIDNCGKGKFLRTWEVSDASGNKVTAVQTVTLQNRSAYKVTFPENKTLICGKGVKDFSPKANGEPIIEELANSCPMVSLSYIDDKYSTGGDGCYKIVRRWRIMNDCEHDGTYNADKGDEYNPKKADGACDKSVSRCFVNIGASILADPTYGSFVAEHSCYDFDSDGFMEYNQIIKVVDYDAPIIGNIEVETEDNFQGNCADGGIINLKKVDVKDCSDSLTITYTSNIPDHGGGKIPSKLIGVPYGKYKINILVSDNCGNFSFKEINVEVKEKKKPTPVCKDNIAVELMQNGTVMVMANMFNAGSFDNCTPQSKLKYFVQVPAPGAGASFVQGNVDSMYVFSCANLKTGTTTSFVSVALWVGDEAGNWDYCETNINIQDNMGACTNNIPIQMKIAGTIKTANADMVEDVTLKLDGAMTSVTSTDKEGKFKFENLYSAKNYDLLPSKNTEPLNGVSTLDLVLMSKHILGVAPFSTMYQTIAGDVNNNGVVTTADIVELRKMILGLQQGFSKNVSWRFVETGKTYDPLKTDWIPNLPNKKTFLNLLINPTVDFVAVKVGDVNGSAKTSNATGNVVARGEENTTFINVDKDIIAKGETVTLNFSTEKPNHIEGYQFTLNYDKNSMELVDIQGNAENFAVLEAGIITTSFNGEIATNNLFGLTFRAKKDANLNSVLQANSQVLHNELYTVNGEQNKVALQFRGAEKGAFELYQNQPNPFNTTTTISFQLPENQFATLTITDVAGRTIKQIHGSFQKGVNQISLDKSELGAAGVMYYRLETAYNFATRKMIIVE
jgi:hypothetical protein